MANVLISNPQQPEQLDRAAGENVASLTGRFDTVGVSHRIERYRGSDGSRASDANA